MYFDTPRGFLYQPSLDPVDQDTRPEPSTSGRTLEEDYDSDDSNNIDDLGAVADLHGEVPIFCRVGTCLYWHTQLGQVKRYQGNHFPGSSFGYWRPTWKPALVKETVSCAAMRKRALQEVPELWQSPTRETTGFYVGDISEWVGSGTIRSKLPQGLSSKFRQGNSTSGVGGVARVRLDCPGSHRRG